MTIIEIAKENNWREFQRPGHRKLIFSSLSRELLEVPKGGTPMQAVTARITASDILANDWDYC